MTAPAFQVVLQFPQDFFASPEAIAAFERKLIEHMPRTVEIDGYDVGSGTVNFFLYTNTPVAAHRAFRTHLGTNAVERRLRIAYRPSEGEEFINLWPRRDPRAFEYSYAAKNDPFARGAKRVIPKRNPPKPVVAAKASVAPKAKASVATKPATPKQSTARAVAKPAKAKSARRRA